MSFDLRNSNSFLKNQCLIDYKIIFLHVKCARRFSLIFGSFRTSIWQRWSDIKVRRAGVQGRSGRLKSVCLQGAVKSGLNYLGSAQCSFVSRLEEIEQVRKKIFLLYLDQKRRKKSRNCWQNDSARIDRRNYDVLT